MAFFDQILTWGVFTNKFFCASFLLYDETTTGSLPGEMKFSKRV